MENGEKDEKTDFQDLNGSDVYSTYSYAQVLQILKGAVMLSSGGGGSYLEAVKLLKPCENKELDVYSVTEETNCGTVVIALMGNPTELSKRDFTKMILNTASFVKSVLPKVFSDGRKNPKYCIPVEMGGFNTAVPIYLAMISKGTAEEIKLMDADGAGRAVPGLDVTYITQKGCSINPFVLASDKEETAGGITRKDTAAIYDSRNAKSCEMTARGICTSYDNLAGVAGWPFLAGQVKDYALVNSIRGCYKIASFTQEFFLNNKKKDIGLFEYLSYRKPIENFKGRTVAPLPDSASCMVISDGKVGRAFDIGKIIIEEKCAPYKINYYGIKYVNESLVLYKIFEYGSRNERYEPIATAPDIITIVDEEEKRALSNDEVVEKFNKNGRRPFPVFLGVINSPKWWELTGGDTGRQTDIWRRYFKDAGYDGQCMKYFNMENETIEGE